MRYSLKLLSNDTKNIIRDPVLLYIFFSPLIIIYGVKYLLPYLASVLSNYVLLNEYNDLISGIILIFVPVVIGALGGFMLLDEKDERTNLMLITTPLGRRGYIIYKLFFPTVITFVYSLAVLPIIGIVKISFSVILPIALLTSIESPICALFITLFSSNKVEGLAVAKGMMLFMLAPVVSYFINSPLKILFGIVPFYWPVNALLINNASDLNFWMNILVGFAIHTIILFYFSRVFGKNLSSL